MEKETPDILPEELKEDEILDIDLKQLYAPNGKYTPEEKIEGVMAYLVTGTSKQASKLCGVPAATIRDWKTRSSWWLEVYSECKKKKQEELDAAFTSLLHEGVGILADRMANGDTRLDKKGDKVQVPLSGRDVAWIMAVFFDKRQLLRGDVTSRSEKVADNDRLTNLQKQFEKMANEVHGYNAKTIDVKVQDEGED